LLDAIAQAAPFLAKGDEAGFMNKVTLLTTPKKEPKPKPKDDEPRQNKSKDE
jgi:PTH1 family peptidyl-tRNA hydrolase